MEEKINSTICRPRASSVDGTVRLTWIKRTALYSWGRDDGTADDPWRFRLLRRTEADFTRNEDYEEYFLGRDAEGADVIFEGDMTPENQRRFTFTDPHVAPRTTYSYFIQALAPRRDDRPIGPIGVRVTDPDIYWTYDRLCGELASLHAQSGGRTTLTTAGHTAAGRAIPCLTVGRTGPRLALLGAIHAGESGPELIVPALRRLIVEQPDLFRKAQVVALPAVNIDGREAQARGNPWYLRQTPAGVDLNRNFPTLWDQVDRGYGQFSDDPETITWRGASPGSAPETRAVMAALSEYRPDVTFSYHGLASVASLPAYSAPIAADDAAYQARCRQIINAYGSGMCPGQPFHDRWTYACGSGFGSLGTWLYDFNGTPSFDLELLPPAVEWQEMLQARHDRTDRAMLADYQARQTHALAAVLTLLGDT